MLPKKIHYSEYFKRESNRLYELEHCLSGIVSQSQSKNILKLPSLLF